MEFVMLFFSAIIIVCIVGNKLSARIGVPSLLIFLALGMICGSDGILKIPFDNYQLSEQVCTVCLIFIMFCGGFSANWKAAKPVALRAGLLSSLGTIVTALITTAGCHFLIGFDKRELSYRCGYFVYRCGIGVLDTSFKAVEPAWRSGFTAGNRERF